VNPWYIDSVRKTGVTIINVSKWFNCVSISTNDTNQLHKILALPFVTGIDSLAETPAKPGAKRIPKDFDSATGKGKGTQSLSLNEDEYHGPFLKAPTTYNYGSAYTQVHMLGVDYLHDLGYCGQGMVIAILDAGFYRVDSLALFDSIRLNNQILGTRDFVNPGNNVYNAGTHGMMVLSTIAANGSGEMVGTAPKASFWLLRTEDGNTEYPIEEDNWARGAEYADSVGADVINSSLGYTNFDNPEWSHTYSQMNGKTCRASRAATMAASKGILVVNSAGNSGAQAWNYIGAPADADSIITVGAVDASGIYASFSSNGPTYDGRVKPTVCAMGLAAVVCSSTGNPLPGNGTSFASPIMAGAVTCLWQANPGLSNQQVIQALTQSANHYTSPDTLYGYGIPSMVAANLILSKQKIYNFDTENKINVFPNPFSGQFCIVFDGKSTDAVDVALFDLAGQNVLSMDSIHRNPGINNIYVKDLSSLKAGVYVLKVKSGKSEYLSLIHI
jgi:hypothetical protein